MQNIDKVTRLSPDDYEKAVETLKAFTKIALTWLLAFKKAKTIQNIKSSRTSSHEERCASTASIFYGSLTITKTAGSCIVR